MEQTTKTRDANWTGALKYEPANRVRPVLGRTANGFKELLLKTLSSGALRIEEKALPIKVKSLRTQAVAIAKTAKAMSHVITRDGAVYMWLEPANGSKRAARSKPGPKPGQPRANSKRVEAPNA